MYTTRFESPLGVLRVFAPQPDRISGLWFEDVCPFSGGTEEDVPVFSQVREWLRAYFSGENPPVNIPFTVKGTPYQKKIWDLLLQIPYASTISYGELAQPIHTSARSLGGAVGCNPISIIIPCHRVVGKDGELVGYNGGIERKRALIDMERKFKRDSQNS